MKIPNLRIDGPLALAAERRYRVRLPSLIFLVILAAIFPWLHHRWRQPRNLWICQSNLKNLATALEMYSSDNGGCYPVRLSELVSSRHLEALPVCPEAGFCNYLYEVSDHPDEFTVGCRGRYHGEPSQTAPAKVGMSATTAPEKPSRAIFPAASLD